MASVIPAPTRISTPESNIRSNFNANANTKISIEDDDDNDHDFSYDYLEIENGDQEVLKNLLEASTHLYICKLTEENKIRLSKLPEESGLSSSIRSLKSYSILNQNGDDILIAKQLEIDHFDSGRLSIAYDVNDLDGQRILSTDGYETRCGMHVLIKGGRTGMCIIRGKLTNDAFNRYTINDYLMGIKYRINVPFWVILCTCFVFCFRTQISVYQYDDDDKLRKKVPVAWIGNSRTRTEMENVQFTIIFNDSTTTTTIDSKLFIFSAALIIYHHYFKKSARDLRCLCVYSVSIIITILILLIIIYSLNPRSFSTNQSMDTNM